MSLHDKIQETKAVLEQVLRAHDSRRAAVAWTAGKDSTVVLWLWRSLLLEMNQTPVLAVNLDTGVKFPEVTALRDELATEWAVELKIQVPDVDFLHYPLARDKLECCKDLKILPLQRALTQMDIAALLTGLRRDEHPDRMDRDVWERRQNPDHVQVNPILNWTEMDVWAFILDRGLPYCSLYDQGYRSLGCMPCTQPVELVENGGERSGRDQDKERQMETLRGLGYF
ncbi:MAG TPA: phosphoadenosine phosphosulfate reductase family protein [Desulfonatronum sp.]|nr:phosphoadenosine phosphosulfate reductase family protein [Desulfonatronum sp.]